MKQFTCTEEVLKHDSLVMYKGDVATVEDGVADYFCANGWGTCEGVTTGERIEGASKVTLNSTTTP